jgi:hypothetical protein
MALIYHLAAHCKNQHIAQHMVHKYAGQTFVFNSDKGTLYNGDVCRFSARTTEPSVKEWWCEIIPSGVTNSGIANEQEAKRADEFANVMYGMLKNEPYFGYAIIGVEVGEFRDLAEMVKDLKDSAAWHSGRERGETLWLPEGHPGYDPVAKMDGLVVSNSLVQEHGGQWNSLNSVFLPFSGTHKWLSKVSEIENLKKREKHAPDS